MRQAGDRQATAGAAGCSDGKAGELERWRFGKELERWRFLLPPAEAWGQWHIEST